MPSVLWLDIIIFFVLQVDLDQQHKALDDIISNLESSLLDLQ